ncbi:MAG: SRPBCC domain-containing protein [Hyphomicrobium sp.]|nr:SRPBCC domain-containing protein [Hyphomicrobium sp.]
MFAAGALATIITWQLTPKGAGTSLRLRHERFNLDTPMGRQALEGVKSGWPAVLERLARTLEKLLEQVKSQAVLVH